MLQAQLLMQQQAQPQARWLGLPSSSRARPQSRRLLSLEQLLGHLAMVVQKSLPSEVLPLSSSVAWIDLLPLQLVVLELHLSAEAASSCCVHNQAYLGAEPHLVVAASLSLGKMLALRARQLRRPEMQTLLVFPPWPQRSWRCLEHEFLRLSPELMMLPLHDACKGSSSFQCHQSKW